MAGPLDFALAYIAGGMSVLPVRRDGTKAPACPSWKQYQSRPAGEAEARGWWEVPRPPGIALVCGAASGGLEVLDFDHQAETIYPLWRALVEEAAPGLCARLTLVRTPRGGRHVWFRSREAPVPGNTKLAGAGPDVLIETRGEGGYALAPGCPADCHEAHRHYVREGGPPLTRPAVITAGEREVLMAMARAFDRQAAPEAPPRLDGVDLRPGDHFDRAGSWDEVLPAHGWECVATIGPGERRWRRPGKALGWSATTGRCSGSSGEDLLRVFSSNAAPFEAGKSYGKFRAWALLNANGDWREAASLLRSLGYGRGGSYPARARVTAPPPPRNGQPCVSGAGQNQQKGAPPPAPPP